MKFFLTILFISFISSTCFAQDVIVLKKDELIIKCQIISVSDTSIIYTDWKSAKKDSSVIARSEVLSYMIDTKSRQDNNLPVTFGIGVNSAFVPIATSGNRKVEAPEIKTGNTATLPLLGPYKSNEIVEGYIIKINGDTVKGFISVVNVAMNQIQVAFRNNSEDTLNTYTPEELTGYGYGNVQYKKVKSPFKKPVTNMAEQKSEYLFLHLVIDGPSELYRLFTLKYKSAQLRNSTVPPYYSGKLKTHYLITNAGGESICTKGRTLKGSLNRIYNDNKIVKEYIYKEGVNETRLPQIVELYNNTVGNQ